MNEIVPFHPLTVYIFSWFAHAPLVGTLILLMVIDCLMGFAAAFISKKISSSVSWTGMTRKVMTLGVISLAALLQAHIPGMPAAQIIALFYVGHEAISVLEKAAMVGVPLPFALLSALTKYSEFRRNENKPIISVNLDQGEVKAKEMTIVNTAENPVHIESAAVKTIRADKPPKR